MAAVFNFNMFADFARPFIANYRCFSVTMLPGIEREDVSQGGKIFIPPSALEQLTRHQIFSPMIFKITNKATKKSTHCGVLEFIAEEGRVYIPLWMMKNLLLNQGDYLQVESVTLPVATFSKFQAQSVDFLDISNQKAVLEKCLRSFACLTIGDIIPINYNKQLYELCVIETKPGPAVTIIECDMNVEFISPVGYREPRARKKSRSDDIDDYQIGGGGGGGGVNDNRIDDNDVNDDDNDDGNRMDKDMDEFNDRGGSGGGGGSDPDSAYRAEFDDQNKFQAFAGSGTRLDGKAKSQEQDVAEAQLNSEQRAQKLQKRGIPDFNYEIGSIRFIRAPLSKKSNTTDDTEKGGGGSSGGFKAFGGKGATIRNN